MRTRYEISISYKDRKGVARYANRLGNFWFDPETGKGSIELPPGVSLVGGGEHWINVELPRERDGGQQQQQGQRKTAEGGHGHGGGDDIPFGPLRGEV